MNGDQTSDVETFDGILNPVDDLLILKCFDMQDKEGNITTVSMYEGRSYGE